MTDAIAGNAVIHAGQIESDSFCKLRKPREA